MKKAFRILSLILALSLCIGLLSACGGKKQSSSGLRSADLVLDWYPNALHTFIYTAIARGYYAEEGIDLHIQFPSNTTDALSLVSAGKAEFGFGYQHETVQAVADQGVKIKSVAAIVQGPLSVVMSLKEKNINSPRDLAGKTVGYSGTALLEAIVQNMVESEGVDPSSVQLVDVGFDLMSSMTTGNVDATIGCLVNHEVPQLEEEGFEVNYWLETAYGVPDFYENVFIVSDELLEKDPELIKGFLRASLRGFEDFKADPYGCLNILLENQNEENFPLSESVEKKSCDIILTMMEKPDAAFLSQDDANWQANIDWMLENGLCKNRISLDDVRVNLDWRK